MVVPVAVTVDETENEPVAVVEAGVMVSVVEVARAFFQLVTRLAMLMDPRPVTSS
jgi:hypothetical protein